MEACYSANYWGRLFQQHGFAVKLIPAQHVKPFVRGHKNDRNDALAIAEASQRPNMRFVNVKSIEQQDMQSLHRIRKRYGEIDICANNWSTVRARHCVGVENLSQWANELEARRGFNKACVALAHKLARIVWAVLRDREAFKVVA